MKLLFLDLELAHSKNGGKICEFGYVKTNEKFEVIKQENLIINPNIKRKDWDWYALKKILNRKVEQYENEKTFDKYYPKIKTIIEDVDYIFGHSLHNDVKAIKAELDNNNYPALIFDFYDVKNCFKEYLNVKKDTGLIKICNILGISIEGKEHDAMYDSINTMLILKYIAEKEKLTIEEIISLCPTMKMNSVDCLLKKKNNQKVNKKSLKYIIENTRKDNNGNDSLKNKKVYICYTFTKQLITETKNLVQLIINEGGEVVRKTEDADIFIQLNESIKVNNVIIEPMTNKHYEEAVHNGKSIEKIDLKNFLSNFDISIDDLSNGICYTKINKKEELTEQNKHLTRSIAEIYNKKN